MAKKIFVVLVLVVLISFAIYYWYTSSGETESTNTVDPVVVSQEAESQDLFERSIQAGMTSGEQIDEVEKSKNLFDAIQKSNQ